MDIVLGKKNTMNSLSHPGRIALLVLYMFPFLSVIFSLFSWPSSAWSLFVILAFPGSTLLFLLMLGVVVWLRASRYYLAPLNGFVFMSLGSFLLNRGVFDMKNPTFLASDGWMRWLLWEFLIIPMFFVVGIVLMILVTHIVHHDVIPRKYWKQIGWTVGGLVLLGFLWRQCLAMSVCIS